MIMISTGNNRHGKFQSITIAAATTTIVLAALIVKRRKQWNSESSRQERNTYQLEITQSLMKNSKLISVEENENENENENEEKPLTNKIRMLTTYNPSSQHKKDSITLVLIHGFGCTSLEFLAMQRLLNERVPVFSYDRVLFVENFDDMDVNKKRRRSPSRRDAHTLAIELHTLLQNSQHVSPPYLLLGHSYGGLIAQFFAHLYPSETKGLVLLDPAHERQWLEFPADFVFGFIYLVPAVLKLYEKIAWTGCLQWLDRWGLFNFPPTFLFKKEEASIRTACVRLYSNGHVWRRVADELQGCNETFDRILHSGSHQNTIRESLRSIPTALIIASHRRYSPTFFPHIVTQAFRKMHEHSLPHAKVFWADQSDHWIHMQQPDMVLNAIEYVMQENDLR
mmetsp:Transcript_27707/g.41938  ORF Transcript_27707/g.41938 Transcript_27707/m.41938 type:complete len:395 (-) Transcript_27707:265-1449(-)